RCLASLSCSARPDSWTPRPPPDEPMASGPDVNILLVDDQPANLLALEGVLEQPGVRLIRATSGLEALERLAERDFAVVLLDVRMPGVDGFETARRIRDREATIHTPIIFLTAADTRAEDVA